MSDEVPALEPQVGWICIDCVEPEALARWWSRLIGGDVEVDRDGDVVLHAQPLPLLFLRVPERKAVKNRLHVDIRSTDYEAAVRQAVAIGAQPAEDVYTGDRWQVLRDPEGNEFCILRPRND
ncbi:MAG TPA: VOC family protein [Acidimicrobiales bacterium]|nr:VOC family protein [Acidimicrobiales bacterium]